MQENMRNLGCAATVLFAFAGEGAVAQEQQQLVEDDPEVAIVGGFR